MGLTRREFLITVGVASAVAVADGPRLAQAQGRSITASHSVSTFV